MIYENGILIDASNPDELTIKSDNIKSSAGVDKFNEIIKDVCSEYGFKIHHRYFGRYEKISLNNKHIDFVVSANDIRFYDNKTLAESVIKFSKYDKKTNTPEVFTLNLAKLKSGLEKKIEETKLRKQNKNVVVFKEQMFAPYVDGVFKEAFPDSNIVSQGRFSYRIDFKAATFHIYIRTKAMSKLDFSQIDFDDVPCSIDIYKGIEVYKNNIRLGDIQTFKDGLETLLNAIYERWLKFEKESNDKLKAIKKLEEQLGALKKSRQEQIDNFHTTTKDIAW